MKKSDNVVATEGWISFLIPFLSGVGGASILSNTQEGRIIALICSSLVAGLSGLKSFLSTTFADNNRQPQTPDNTAQPKKENI